MGVVWLLRYCPRCKRYTLHQDSCPVCGGPVRIPHPAKFSPEDRYRRYRLQMRRIARREEEPTSTRS